MIRRLGFALALTVAAACGPSQPPATPPAATGIESAALGLRLTSLPEGFSLTLDQADRIVFDAPAGALKGTATIELGATSSSAVNLVAEAKAFGEAAAAQGGKFFGGNELVTPFGSAYTVRILVDRGLTEERAVFLLHPDGSGRLLVLRLRYPPGDAEGTRARMLQALELVGALEPLAATAAVS
jgi:hypothetical protein